MRKKQTLHYNIKTNQTSTERHDTSYHKIPNIRGVIRRDLKLLYSDPNNKTLFPKKDLIVGYSRAKNLKEILVPTKLPTLGHHDDNSLPWGCFKYKAKTCDICKNYLVPGN